MHLYFLVTNTCICTLLSLIHISVLSCHEYMYLYYPVTNIYICTLLSQIRVSVLSCHEYMYLYSPVTNTYICTLLSRIHVSVLSCHEYMYLYCPLPQQPVLLHAIKHWNQTAHTWVTVTGESAILISDQIESEIQLNSAHLTWLSLTQRSVSNPLYFNFIHKVCEYKILFGLLCKPFLLKQTVNHLSERYEFWCVRNFVLNIRV